MEREGIDRDVAVLVGKWRVDQLITVNDNGITYDSSLYIKNDMEIPGEGEMYFKNLTLTYEITERFKMQISGDKYDEEAKYRVRTPNKIMLCSSFEVDRLRYPSTYYCYQMIRLE
jgi:hypothetical protein